MDAKLTNTRLAAMTVVLRNSSHLLSWRRFTAVGAAFYIIGKNAESAQERRLRTSTSTRYHFYLRPNAVHYNFFRDQEGLTGLLASPTTR